MMKTILAILLFAGTAQAGVPYWQAPQASTHTAYGTGYLSGVLKVYPSTSTAAASPSIQLNGPLGWITATSSITASGGFYGDLTGNAATATTATNNVLKTGDTMSGQLTINGDGSFFPGVILNQEGVWRAGFWYDTNNSITMLGGGNFGEGLMYKRATGRVGLDTLAPTHKFHVTGDGLFTSSVTATGGLYGNLTGDVTGLASLNLPLTGGTLTGPLTLSGSSLTVTGSAFSVGGSTFACDAGRCGVGGIDTNYQFKVVQLPGSNGSVAVFTSPNSNGSSLAIDTVDGGAAADAKLLYNNNGSPVWITGFEDSGDSYDIAYQDFNTGKKVSINTYGDMAISADGFSVGTSTFVVTGGKVGVGTASPASNLHVASTDVLDSPRGPIVMSRLWNNVGDTRASSIFHYYDSTAANDRMAFGVSGNGGDASNPDAIPRVKMVIDAAGKVGIGTTSPASKVDISSGTIRMAGTGSPAKGGALCLTAAGIMGKCTTAIDASGDCTCTAP